MALDNEPEQLTPVQQQYLRQLAKAAMISIRVANPTNDDYVVKWNAAFNPELWRVPNRNKDTGRGLGQAVVPQYVAIKYYTEMSDKILTEESDSLIKKVNLERVKKGQLPLTPNEQLRIELRTNDKARRKEIFKQLYVRVEEEYGVDREAPEEYKPADLRPIDVQIMEEIENERKGIVPQQKEMAHLPAQQTETAAIETVAESPGPPENPVLPRNSYPITKFKK